MKSSNHRELRLGRGGVSFSSEGKFCYKCQRFLSYDCFYKNASRPSGYNSQCRECSSVLRRDYYDRNREKEAAVNKAYRSNNHDFVLSLYREHYWSNKKKHREKNKKWREENPEKDRVRYHRRRGRKSAVFESWSPEDEVWLRNVFQNRCFKCGCLQGASDGRRLSVDHFRPLLRGNALSRTNAVLLCSSCNSSKGTKDPEDFFSGEEIDIIEKIWQKGISQ